MIERVYFDMDGVLADFEGGVRTLCGMECLPQDNVDEAPEAVMWEAIRQVDRFYDKLSPLPGAVALFRAVYRRYGDRCQILTGIPKPHRGIPTAGEDKTRWVRRLLDPGVTVNVVYREEKQRFCTGPECLLIDDFYVNTQAWEDFGGTAILHRNARSTRDKLKRRGVL